MSAMETGVDFAGSLAHRTLVQIGLLGPWWINPWLRFRTEAAAVLVVVAVAAGWLSLSLQGTDIAKCSMTLPADMAGGAAPAARQVAITCASPTQRLAVPWPTILVSVPATLAFLVGYLQWRAGRREASFEQYYTRLAAVHGAFNAFRLAEIETVGRQPTDAEKQKQGHLRTMFVFAELDHLEYMLGKLRLGYVASGLAERAVRGFVGRCLTDEFSFRGDLLWWVGERDGQQHAKGYQRATILAVRYILTQIAASEAARGSTAVSAAR